MAFSNPVFTDAGKQLYLRASAGETITFTSISVGEGKAGQEEIAALNALVSPVKSMAITGKIQGDDRFMVTGTFRNDEISHSFYWKEYGVFAADPDYPSDRTKDILVLYQSSDDNPEYISISSGEISEKTVRVSIYVGARTVTALVDSAVLVSMAELTETLTGYALKDDIPTSLPANGGNADTVGNISATNLVRTLGVISDTDFLNNAAFYEYSYEASINATTASAIGLPAKFYIIKGFQFVNNGKYAVQIAYPRNHTGQAMIRYANGTDWTSWKGLGDGCNADTVDGKHAAEFFPKSDLSHSFALGVNPDANESKLMAFSDSTGSTSKLLGWLAHTQYADGTSAIGIVVRNNVVSGQTLFGVTVRISEDGKTYYATTMAPSSPSLSALRNIASGTAAATTSNCPNGAWYGKHE